MSRATPPPNQFENVVREAFREPEVQKLLSQVHNANSLEKQLTAHLVGADRVKRFRAQLLKAPNCKKLLVDLSQAGCSELFLVALLRNASTVASADPKRLLETSISTKQLKKLTKDLLNLAQLVDRVNKTPLNPKFDLLGAPTMAEKTALRRETARLYDMLPGIMQTYAVQLERFARLHRAILRRLTEAQCEALRVLRYINEMTGSPHYEPVANLLSAGFSIISSEKELPQSFSADALTKLYQRMVKLDKKRTNKA